jgi:hypothetical protein
MTTADTLLASIREELHALVQTAKAAGVHEHAPRLQLNVHDAGVALRQLHRAVDDIEQLTIDARGPTTPRVEEE